MFRDGMQEIYIHFIMTEAKSNLGSRNPEKVESLLRNQSITHPGPLQEGLCLN